MADGRKQLPIVNAGEPDKKKRRLPVVQPLDEAEQEAYERPAWHWVVIGAVGSFLFFLLGLQLTQWFAHREILRLVGEGEEAIVRRALLTDAQEAYLNALIYGLPLICLLASSWFGGLLVGRFGGQAGGREATLSGMATGGLTAAIAATSMWPRGEAKAWALAAMILIVVGALGGWRGGKRGLGRRDRQPVSS